MHQYKYTYKFRLTPARQKSALIFSDHRQIIHEAAENVNGGLTFIKDRKKITIAETDIGEREMIVILSSMSPLANPARSLSALTRYLTTKYPNTFDQYIYNKTLFNIHILSQETTSSPHDMSCEDILKCTIDLLYTWPQTREVQVAKAQIIEILRPFVEKRFDRI